MLKTIVEKLLSRKFLALVGTVTAAVAGENMIESFPSWVILILGVVYILGNVAQKFLLGWLDLKKNKA